MIIVFRYIDIYSWWIHGWIDRWIGWIDWIHTVFLGFSAFFPGPFAGRSPCTEKQPGAPGLKHPVGNLPNGKTTTLGAYLDVPGSQEMVRISGSYPQYTPFISSKLTPLILTICKLPTGTSKQRNKRSHNHRRFQAPAPDPWPPATLSHGLYKWLNQCYGVPSIVKGR